MEEGQQYTFEVHYDDESKEFVYERLTAASDARDNVIYLRDTLNEEYECDDPRLTGVMPALSRDNILIYLVDPSKFDVLQKARQVLRSFASRIDVIDMIHIPIGRTIALMKDDGSAEPIREFVRRADLSIDDFRYETPAYDIEARISPPGPIDAETERFMQARVDEIQDQLSLVSTYRGIDVPSLFYDSRGTKIIQAVAGYITEALRSNRILVIDEFGAGLHFLLTRAILTLINSEANTAAQLIGTTHDATLLDCKQLLRKEQIWFSHKDEDGAYLYSLADFKARQDGIRDTSDLLVKYKSGILGALPDPDLFPYLLEVTDAQ